MEYANKLCTICKHATEEQCPCVDYRNTHYDYKTCEEYYPRFDKTAESIKKLPIISIEEFNKKVARGISSKIDTSKIKTVEDIYNQSENFSGAMMSVSPNLEMLSNLACRVSFSAWWVVEDSNNHHCIIW